VRDLDVPWNRITVLVLALAIIFCSTVLALYSIADWNDVYTIFLIVLTGIGFGSAGVYYGEAKAYKYALDVYLRKGEEKKETEKETVQEDVNV